MSEPPADPPESVVYLDVDDALEIFGAIIGGTATEAAGQLRDRAALAGALARPRCAPLRLNVLRHGMTPAVSRS